MKNEQQGLQKRRKATPEEDLQARSEDLKTYISEAVMTTEELKDSFEQWLAVNTEADVILDAKRVQEGDLRRSFRKDAAVWD